MIPLEFRKDVQYRKTRMMGFPYAGESIMTCEAVSIQYRNARLNVTDRQTNGQTDGIPISISRVCIAVESKTGRMKMQVRNNETGASIDRWRNHPWIALRNRHYKTPKQTCELKK